MTRFSRLMMFLVFLIGVVLILMIIFGRGGKTENDKIVKATRVFSTVDYVNSNSYAVTTISGPIVGNDKHNEVRITVTPDKRTIDVIQGYQGKVVSTKTYPNNRQAYQEFLHALNRQVFGKARKTKLTSEGVCATGKRYRFEFYDQGKLISDTWAGSCSKGNALSESTLVIKLFKNQITDYNKLTKGLGL